MISPLVGLKGPIDLLRDPLVFPYSKYMDCFEGSGACFTLSSFLSVAEKNTGFEGAGDITFIVFCWLRLSDERLALLPFLKFRVLPSPFSSAFPFKTCRESSPFLSIDKLSSVGFF